MQRLFLNGVWIHHRTESEQRGQVSGEAALQAGGSGGSGPGARILRAAPALGSCDLLQLRSRPFRAFGAQETPCRPRTLGFVLKRPGGGGGVGRAQRWRPAPAQA